MAFAPPRPRRSAPAGLALALLTGLALLRPLAAAVPSDLAPGAPEVQTHEQRVRELLATTRAVATSTARLQTAWALPATPAAAPEAPAPKGSAAAPKPTRALRPLTATTAPPRAPCADTERLALGWRIERMGLAWRDAAQATRAAAARLKAAREAPTAAPLVDGPWATQLTELTATVDRAVRAWREASAWQARFVRPTLQACPAPVLTAAPGVDAAETWARGEGAAAVAVLAMGPGYVCPDGQAGEDSVVVLSGGEACWSAALPCACAPAPVAPGALFAEPTAR